MNTYNTAPPTDEVDRAKGELAQVKNIMVQNVEQILSRGERIELLVDKTDNMAHQATAFRRGARTVRRQQFWRNQKIMLLSVAVGLVSEDCVCIAHVIMNYVGRLSCGLYSHNSAVPGLINVAQRGTRATWITLIWVCILICMCALKHDIVLYAFHSQIS